MWFYAFALALGLASLQIMVHQWHLSYISWGIFMIVVAAVMTFLKITSAKEFSKRDKEFDEVRTLAASFLGDRHRFNSMCYVVSPYELDTLIINSFKTERLFKNYYDYKFQRKLNLEIISLIMIMDAVSMLIGTGEYHKIEVSYDELNDKGCYFYNMYKEACEELEALAYFSEDDIDNYLDKLDELIEHVGYNLLSKQAHK